MLFHASENYFPHGYLGVDIFFVISGFVVTPLIVRIFTEPALRNGHKYNFKQFYIRRFYRLAPALASTLIISTIVILLLAPPDDHESYARQGISTLLFIGNFGAYRYSGNYFSPNPNPLVHTWSLSVEEQIYIFLPLILMITLFHAKNIKKVMITAIILLTGISFISFLFPVILHPIYSHIGINLPLQFSFYSPLERFWQFTIGGAGYLMLSNHQARVRRYKIFLNSLIVIAIVIILLGQVNISFKLNSIIASLIALSAITFKSFDVIPSFLIRKLEWLGDRSYSIYLVHMPLLYIAKFTPMTGIGISDNRNLQTVIAVILSMSLGSISYSRVENRFRGLGKDFDIKLSDVLAALILTLMLPLLLLVSMDFGAKNKYWGLEKSIEAPIGAWELDLNCSRLSDRPKPCMYKALNARRTILLIGDSHAAHISQSVIDAAIGQRWNVAVWTLGSCHVQFERSISNQVTDKCISKNFEILAWVKKYKPGVLIVSEYVYFDSSQIDLKNALIKLRTEVSNVLLIENNPIFPDGIDFLTSRPLIMQPYKPPKSFQLSAMQIKDKFASDQLANWARKNGISTMNFASLFCGDKVCTRFSNGEWLYTDDNHLSVAGAELTIPKLEKYFRRF